MTKFNDVIGAERHHCFEVEWYPEDMPLGDEPIKTLVGAISFDDAWQKISMSIGDVRSVKRINGLLVEAVRR